MDLRYILFMILNFLPSTFSFVDDFDDLFDFDSDEFGLFGDFNYFDYFFPQLKYGTGLCYFHLHRPYYIGDFKAIIRLNSPTTGLTVTVSRKLMLILVLPGPFLFFCTTQISFEKDFLTIGV